MNRAFLILFLILTGCNDNEKMERISEYFENGNVSTILYQKEGVVYSDSIFSVEGMLSSTKNLLKDGLYIMKTYFPNGKIACKGYMKNHQLVREMLCYDENGKLESVEKFEDGKSVSLKRF